MVGDTVISAYWTRHGQLYKSSALGLAAHDSRQGPQHACMSLRPSLQLQVLAVRTIADKASPAQPN